MLNISWLIFEWLLEYMIGIVNIQQLEDTFGWHKGAASVTEENGGVFNARLLLSRVSHIKN